MNKQIKPPNIIDKTSQVSLKSRTFILLRTIKKWSVL